jgi:ferredoxin
MIITKPREWSRVRENLTALDAKNVFIIGCGQCATVAGTGGEPAILAAKARLENDGRHVTGWAIADVGCHSGGAKLALRKHSGSVESADAVLVLSCGAGVQTTADVIPTTAVVPGLESVFLGNVVRHGVFEERCRMCGECVLDATAGICPVTTCPKGLLNGPCGGMWDGKCEVLRDRDCVHVRIQRRLTDQGRARAAKAAPPKDHSHKLGPGSIDLRGAQRDARQATRDLHEDTGREAPPIVVAEDGDAE